MDDSFRQERKSWDRKPRSKVLIDVQTIARYKEPQKEKEEEITVWISDLSEGGMALVTRKQGIPLGAIVRASFRLPMVDAVLPLTVTGCVRRSRSGDGDKFESGIEFVDLSKESRNTIRTFIATQQMNEMF